MDIENARANIDQLSLFPIIPREVCQRIGLNWLSVVELYNTGLLSFDPRDKQQLDEPERTELIFLGSLVVGGCDKDFLESLLTKLKKPYQYHINEIYYYWPSREWRLLPKETELDNQSIFEEWIEELKQDNDIGQLEELQDIVKGALSNIEGT